MFVMEGLEAAAQAARIPTGSKIQVAYSLPPEGGSGFGDMVYATVPMGSVATKVPSLRSFGTGASCNMLRLAPPPRSLQTVCN